MPRQRGGAAPRRPTAAPAKPAPPQAAPARHSSTAAHPPAQQQQAPPQQQGQRQGPGLFGQMASTAAGVAVGSSIGHAVGGWFSGGSSAAPADQQSSTDFAQQHQEQSQYNAAQNGPCATDVGNFRRCMDEQKGDLNICGWYLDQLKACQAAASQY